MLIKTKKIPIKLSNTKVYYDESFQRPECWPTSTRNAYFESLLKGWAKHPITLADAEACLEHAVTTGDLISQEYFSDVLSRGFKFISIDGSHRTKNILRFLANEITVSGDLLDADNEYHSIDNMLYKKLREKHPRISDRLCDTMVTLHVFSDLSRHDLPVLFRAVNQGSALNAHHLRQSEDTPVAPWVRSLARIYSPMMSRIFKEPKRKQMLDHEFIAKMAMSLMSHYNTGNHPNWKPVDGKTIHYWNLAPKDIDKWYEIGKGHYIWDDAVCIYNSAESQRVEKIFKIISSVLCHQTKHAKMIPFKSVWAVTAAAEWAYDNHYSITNHKEFFEALVILDSRLAEASETLYAQERVKAIRNRTDPNTISDRPYYFNWLRYAHASGSRRNRASVLIGEIEKDVGAFYLRKKGKDSSMAAK